MYRKGLDLLQMLLQLRIIISFYLLSSLFLYIVWALRDSKPNRFHKNLYLNSFSVNPYNEIQVISKYVIKNWYMVTK